MVPNAWRLYRVRRAGVFPRGRRPFHGRDAGSAAATDIDREELKGGPHIPYYGSHDGTPLFLILLDEYERWTADTALVRELEQPARCGAGVD
jgi:glycogen debranching enzyme